MAGNDTVGPKSADKSDWSSVWEAVSRLAVTQQSLQANPEHSLAYSRSLHAHRTASLKDVGSLDQDQLAAAIAEIKRASAALRRSEPALEYGLPPTPSRREARNYWSVWIIMAVIWISATFVVASAAGAILYLLG
jgi:hypothetical protein